MIDRWAKGMKLPNEKRSLPQIYDLNGRDL